jgi:thioredoxin reductase (NADPH)
MPGMSGVELIREARRVVPAAKRVLLTAYADTSAAIAAINDAGLDHYLLKPWDPPEERLYPVLDDLLDEWAAHVNPESAGLRIVSSRWSSDGHELRDFLTRNLVPYRWLDVEADVEAATLLAAAAPEGDPLLPLVVLADGGVLSQPTGTQLAERLGMATRSARRSYDVVIVGAGPAGLAAAVYAGTEGWSTLVLERHAPGGQAGLSARIENYLGFPSGLTGGDLARRAVTQAKRFGAELLAPAEATALRVEGGYPVLVLSNGEEIAGRTLLIACGVRYHMLDAPGAEQLTGAGIYYGGALAEADAVAGQDVHVLGGGNSAGQAALHLARFARSVTLLARHPLAHAMSRYLVDRIEAAANILVRAPVEIVAAAGDNHLQSLTLGTPGADTEERVAATALFVFIGARAHTDWLDGVVQRDAAGFIFTGPDLLSDGARPAGWTATRSPLLLETNVPNVFVAGDVRHRPIRGIASAVGEGNMAGQFMHQQLTGESRRRSRRAESVHAVA